MLKAPDQLGVRFAAPRKLEPGAVGVAERQHLIAALLGEDHNGRIRGNALEHLGRLLVLLCLRVAGQIHGHLLERNLALERVADFEHRGRFLRMDFLHPSHEYHGIIGDDMAQRSELLDERANFRSYQQHDEQRRDCCPIPSGHVRSPAGANTPP